MTSINSIVQDLVSQHLTGLNVEVVLSDKIPDICDSPEIIRHALVELITEIKQNSTGLDIRIKTEVKKNVQHIELAWSTVQLTDEFIDMINKRYIIGSECETEPCIHGTKTVGYLLGKCKGKVRIEKFDEAPYTMRNVIELPLR